jgi:hypothetical protein
MFRLKAYGLILLLGLLAPACAGYELRPATPAETGEAPTPTLPATSVPTQTPTTTPVPTVTSTPAGAWISLSPGSGKPGDTVRVDGYLPNPPSEADLKNSNYQTYANICWAGCQSGLMEEALEMDWSTQDAGRFSLSFTVPQAPWLSADGPHPLDAGDYPVVLQYLDMSSDPCPTPSLKGCMREIQAAAPFHLAQGSSGPACPDLSCGRLTLTPAQGAPGDTIQVTGWAPLLELIGAPFGYYLALEPANGKASSQNLFNFGQMVSQEMDGSLTASFQVPQFSGDGTPLAPGGYQVALEALNLSATQDTQVPAKGAPPLLLAPTAFEVTSAPSWTALPPRAPLWIQPASGLESQAVTADPSNPARLAYCTPGAIRVSQDGGESWASVPTGPVETLLAAGPYAIGQSPAACNAVTLDGSHPQSFYAVFSTNIKQYGAPPIYFMGFFTPDGGKTWKPAPTPPEGQSPPMVERFGGFWTDGKSVQELYLGDATGSDLPALQAPPVLVEQTTDGGANWGPASLACPSSGPCLQWGAAPSAISGMGSGLPQWVMASQDDGQTWVSTGQAVELRMNGPHELAALSQNEAVVVSGFANYPLRYTRDGGKTWQALSLPSLPGTATAQFNGLQLLPDGSLAAMNLDTGAWYGLAPAAQDWCPLSISIPGNYPVFLQASGDKAWWLSPVDQTLQSAPLSSFECR